MLLISLLYLIIIGGGLTQRKEGNSTEILRKYFIKRILRVFRLNLLIQYTHEYYFPNVLNIDIAIKIIVLSWKYIGMYQECQLKIKCIKKSDFNTCLPRYYWYHCPYNQHPVFWHTLLSSTFQTLTLLYTQTDMTRAPNISEKILTMTMQNRLKIFLIRLSWKH